VFYSLGGVRAVGLLILILALGASAWWVKSRIDRSYDADRLQRDLLVAKSDMMRLSVSLKIAERQKLEIASALVDAQEKLDQRIGKAVERVKVVVRDNPACRLSRDAISLLNDARAPAELPPASVNSSPSP
jgi:hypothetical protein